MACAGSAAAVDRARTAAAARTVLRITAIGGVLLEEVLLWGKAVRGGAVGRDVTVR
ncbi:hypothetical protein SXIM_49920 [Streptomyces xiamenensis]|uniref:Uncharacterized protein n=1 Tax=Streptomyces xiamenensis TaxID=408015 RepID=A0A0F7CQG6_9ACTN|nr:hypothetical protein SXIM_49920 [Streptomyces xiamenensis]